MTFYDISWHIYLGSDLILWRRNPGHCAHQVEVALGTDAQSSSRNLAAVRIMTGHVGSAMLSDRQSHQHPEEMINACF